MATTPPTLDVDDRVTRAAARAKDLAPDADIASLELSSRRTGMSFQRTRMSADRTLMSVIRTALSLIAFGFTLYQFFARLLDSNVIQDANAGRNFGVALVFLGVGMLVLGIVYHLQFMYGLPASTRSDDARRSGSWPKCLSRFDDAHHCRPAALGRPDGDREHGLRHRTIWLSRQTHDDRAQDVGQMRLKGEA